MDGIRSEPADSPFSESMLRYSSLGPGGAGPYSL